MADGMTAILGAGVLQSCGLAVYSTYVDWQLSLIKTYPQSSADYDWSVKGPNLGLTSQVNVIRSGPLILSIQQN